jgi:hypothetical protein
MVPVIGWVTALMLITPAAPATGSASTVELEMSDLRFCRHAPCQPTEYGYLRGPAGPIPGTDNAAAIVDVPAGATVRWTYKDTGPLGCDSFEICPGHEIMVEDGTDMGRRIGFAEARQGATTVSMHVTEAPGTLIRYFCHINGHDALGQTGILRVTG